jgi:hypothetical protein
MFQSIDRLRIDTVPCAVYPSTIRNRSRLVVVRKRKIEMSSLWPGHGLETSLKELSELLAMSLTPLSLARLNLFSIRFDMTDYKLLSIRFDMTDYKLFRTERSIAHGHLLYTSILAVGQYHGEWWPDEFL